MYGFIQINVSNLVLFWEIWWIHWIITDGMSKSYYNCAEKQSIKIKNPILWQD